MAIPRILIACLWSATVAVHAAYGQDYPNHPLRIVTSETGGPADFTSRLLGQGLTADLGQAVIIDNRPSGVIPGDMVAKARPDGYMLLVYGTPLWIGPLLQKTPYDVLNDFSPISALGSSPSVLVVNPSLPVKSVNELVALAKAKPGELNYASFAVGGGTHVASELFKSMAGINMVAVNYKATGQGVTDLISGQVQVMFIALTQAAPHIKSGKMRALAITSAQKSTLAPDMVTMAESGLPGYEAIVRYGMFAPARTPVAVVTRLNQTISRLLNQPAVKEKFLNAGMEAEPSTPDQLTAAIKRDVETTRKVLRDAGVKFE
jgi:tripartite-type tricarboxylate transporter receptor subunit TctC